MIQKLAGASQTQPLASYAVLLKQVRHTIAQGKERALDAVEREKVRTCWETGKLIHEHILLNQDRAAYGQKVIDKLSKDIGASRTELGYMVQFAKTYPIYRTSGKLTWSHIQQFLSVNEAKQRETLISRASKEKWTVAKTRKEIKNLKVPKSGMKYEGRTSLDEVKPGKPGVYRIVERGGKKYYDLGFSTYWAIKGRVPKVTEPPASDLYTYNAELISVYDGDTFHARIELGFGVMQEMRVRLLSINAPEIISADGLKAKKILEKVLARGNGKILIHSKELDQHGRPLVDVWVSDKNINQPLLDSGYFTERNGE